MAVHIFRGTDSSAPQNSSTPGSWVAIFDACLINGYGAIPAATGWTKSFSGTNKAVYQYTGAAGHSYLRLLDDGLQYQAYVAKLECYEAMTDVDTGTGYWPALDSSWQDGRGAQPVKAPSNNAMLSPNWTMVVNKGNIVFSYNSYGNNMAYELSKYDYTMYFGKFKSYLPGDTTYNEMFHCPTYDSSLDNNGGLGTDYIGTKWLRRDASGVTLGEQSYYSGADGVAYSNLRLGTYTGRYYPIRKTGKFNIGPVELREGSSPNCTLRGIIPGVWAPKHARAFYKDEFFTLNVNGTSRDFLVMDCGTTSTSASYVGQILVETSDTWNF